MSNLEISNGLHENLSNEDYHANKTHMSSSCYKAVLKDLQKFHKEWVLGNREHREPSSALIEGSYTHSLLFEPHLIEKEYAIFDGWHKRGNDWKDFKADNAGKPILSGAQVKKCESYLKAIQKIDCLQDFCTGGMAEASLFGDFMGIPTKVRFDYIIPEQGIIFDLKTSFRPVDIESFSYTIKEYGYHISSALYLNLAEQYWKRPFDFYFGAISKSELDAEIYKLSDAKRQEGLDALVRAGKIYKNALKTGDWSGNVQLRSAGMKSNYEILEI